MRKISIFAVLAALCVSGAFAEDSAAQLAKDAAALSNEGKHDDARQKFEAAVKLDSSNASLHLNLGFVYMKLKQHDKATSSLEAAVKLDGKLLAAHKALAFLYEEAAMQAPAPKVPKEDFKKAQKEWAAVVELSTDPFEIDMAKKHLARIAEQLK